MTKYPPAKTFIRFVNIDDASVQAFRKEFIVRYGSLELPLSGAEGATQPSRPSRGKRKSKNPSGSATNLRSLGENNHDDTALGRTASTGTNTLSDFSDPPSVNLTYSGALKKNANGSGTDRKRGSSSSPGGRENMMDKVTEGRIESARNLIKSDQIISHDRLS